MLVVQLLPTMSCSLCLTGKRHDGGGSIQCGGRVLVVSEAVQVLVGGIDGAVDGPFVGASDAVLLSLTQVVGDASFC